MDNTLFYRTDTPVTAPAVSLTQFLGESNATAVRIEPGDDARTLINQLDRIALIEIAFTAFRDGRGYSSARILREAGYAGELRAEGDVLIDQIPLMRRCGFDSFAPAKPVDSDALKRMFGFFPNVYQSAADGAVPIWKLRHG